MAAYAKTFAIWAAFVLNEDGLELSITKSSALLNRIETERGIRIEGTDTILGPFTGTFATEIIADAWHLVGALSHIRTCVAVLLMKTSRAIQVRRT
jgi:hypothetical protein